MQTGTVSIGSKQWTVSIATTITELTAGLSGVASIPANTGMLFNLGSNLAVIPIHTLQMLFSLDIIFINEELGVVGIWSNVAPGYQGTFEMDVGAEYFLEVNEGEADGLNLGDAVTIQVTDGADGADGGDGIGGFDVSSIMEMMIMLVVVVMMMKMMTGTIGS